jgi:hypothetical protein
MMMGSGAGMRGSGFAKHATLARNCAPVSRQGLALLSTCLAVGLAIVLLVLAEGCRHNPVPQSAGFFPATNEVLGWATVGQTRTFQADHLWEYIDGDAEKYLQAGVKKTLTTDYRYKEKIDAVADVYVMTAPEGARKIFEGESSVGSQPVELGDGARLAKGALSFRKGPYFVRLVAYEDAPDLGNALVELGEAIEMKLERGGTGG